MSKLFFMFTFFIFLLGIIQPYAYSCEIDAPKTLIITERVESYELNSAFSYKNCNDTQIKNFNLLLTDYIGELNQRILTSEINDKKTILKNSFQIISLNTAINERVHLPEKWKIIDLKTIGQTANYFALNNDEHIQVSCNNCNNTGTKNIKFEIVDPVANSKESHWITGNVAIAVEALVARNNISITNQALNKSDFEFKTVYSARPENFFTFLDKLPYYKNHRPLRVGQVIHYNDLSPLNLVNMGSLVNVRLNSNGLKLEGKAIPTSSGKLGEIIQLKNPKTNKIIVGKIINFNEVEVEL